MIVVLANPMQSRAAHDRSLRDFVVDWTAYRGAEPVTVLMAVPDLSGVTPLLMFTYKADPDRQQGEMLAERANEAGQSTLAYRGLVHPSWLFKRASPEARLVMDAAKRALAGRLQRA